MDNAGESTEDIDAYVARKVGHDEWEGESGEDERAEFAARAHFPAVLQRPNHECVDEDHHRELRVWEDTPQKLTHTT